MLLNLVKQAASIDSSGRIILGSAVAGGFAIQFDQEGDFYGAPQTLSVETGLTSFVQYVLTNASGDYEIGLVRFNGSGVGQAPRQILESNLIAGGFQAPSAGLTFSVSQVANNSCASSIGPANQNNSGSYSRAASMPPAVYGIRSIALGPGTQGHGNESLSIGGYNDAHQSITIGIGARITDGGYGHVVVGSRARADGFGAFAKTIVGAHGYAYYAGETTVGNQFLPKRNAIPIVTAVPASGTVNLTDAAGEEINLMSQTGGPGDLRGDCQRVTGRIFVRPASFSANAEAMVFSFGPGIFMCADTDVSPAASGTFVVDPPLVSEFSGASSPPVTLSFQKVVGSSALLRAVSTAAYPVLITGIIEVEYLGVTPGFDVQPAEPYLAAMPPGLAV